MGWGGGRWSGKAGAFEPGMAGSQLASAPSPGVSASKDSRVREASMEAVVRLRVVQGQERQAQGCCCGRLEQPSPRSCQHWADVPHPPPASFSTTPDFWGVSLQASLPPTLASSCDQLGPKEPGLCPLLCDFSLSVLEVQVRTCILAWV